MSDETPFHRGELQIQELLGVREEVHTYAPRFIRGVLPEQHRAFYGQQSMIIVGSVSSSGQPTASIVFGRPGFMSTLDERTLVVSAMPVVGDPLEERLRLGAPLGMLGIDLETKRRNRVNGRVSAAGAAGTGFRMKVDQAFGNCPQHIRVRSIVIDERIDAPRLTPSANRTSDHLDAAARAIVETSGTFFIASAYIGDPEDVRHGVDVSHRGGAPGFLRVENERTLLFPDFSGNRHFNTIGNLTLHPPVGLLFVDFRAGDLLQVEGEAEIVWEDPLLDAFNGAERFVRITISEVRHLVAAAPLAFGEAEASVNEGFVGTWAEAELVLAARNRREERLAYDVFEVRAENDVVRSLHLRPADGGPVPSRLPGQYLPITLRPAGAEQAVERTYTISNASPDHLRISVRRQGVASNYLHDEISVGDRIEARAPAGEFVLDESSERPVVFLSAGIGVTPMMAMLEHLVAETPEGAPLRRTFFVHGARRGREHTFAARVREISAQHPERLSVHVAYSDPADDDRLGSDYDEAGFVSSETLRRLLPLDDYDVYLCGPPGFMRALHGSLRELGIAEERIHMEAFGPASLPAPTDLPEGPVEVRFARSDKTLTWTPETGSLLQLAESAGIDAPFGCRTGACGTCATTLSCGSVSYPAKPSAPIGPNQIALCTARPRVGDGCGAPVSLVLEL